MSVEANAGAEAAGALDASGPAAARRERFRLLLRSPTFLVGASVLLLRSFFFAIADSAERLLPALSPGAVHDDRPLMKPVRKPARSLALSVVNP